MRIKTNIVKLLAVLVILGSLVAIAAVPASAAVGYTIPTPTGSVGSSVTIQATGFTEDQILTAKFDGVPMGTSPATVTVPATGNINFTVIVPVTTAGAHKIEVFSDGQTISVTPPTFTVTAKVVVTSPTTKQGSVGSEVKVAGTGFSGASVSATVTIGGQPVGGPVSVDSTGSFTATGTVPAVGAGSKTVTASDGAGNVAATTDLFSVTPTLAVNPASGLGGSKVTLSGSGWTVSSTVTVKLTGQAWTTVATDASGNILPQSPQPAITPSSPLGSNQIVGYDTNYPTVPAATTTFSVVARSLTVTPVSSGPRGTQLLVTGTNMTPSTTSPPNSKILANSLVIIGTSSISLNPILDIPIDTQGVISPTTVWIPAGASLGANMIRATDNSGLVAIAIFTVTQPAITINPATGPRGTSVIVTGLNWLPPSTVKNTAVTIGVYPYGQKTGVLSTQEITTTPDPSGSFAAGITVPTVPTAGKYSIYARDANSNEAVLADFTVPGAAITVSPPSGVALDTITVNGTGFKPYWGVKVSLGTGPAYTFSQQVFTDVLGVFTFSGQVPGLAPGATVVSATDDTSTATTFFTLMAGAPTVKSIVTPIASQLVRIWGFSGGTWSMYDPADAAGSNLATLTPGSGYWINANAACTLVYGGYSYALSSGWNLIGWR